MGIVVSSAIESKIDGVTIVSLKQIEDERGAVLHMIRSDLPSFSRFGEVYFSIVNPDVIKAWKLHRAMTQRFAVPIGRIRLALFDDRGDSPSNGRVEEIIIGRPDRYFLICIPPMVWYGFQAISEMPALLANCSDMPHDPQESEQLPISNNYIPYDWGRM